jgi:hypothetical protein
VTAFGSGPSAGGALQPLRTLLQRLRALRPAEQAAIPATYAWGVTVAPIAWQSTLLSWVAAFLALLSLAAAIVLERRSERMSLASPAAFDNRESLALRADPQQPGVSGFAGALAVWGFSGMSAAVWILASSRALLTFDGVRGATGCAGWMLFAFTACGPVVPRSSGDAVAELASARSHRLPRLDGILMLGSFLGVVVLQGIGWSNREPERGILLRLLAAALSMGWLGASTAFAAERYHKRETRVRTSTGRMILYALFGLAAAVFPYLR